MSGELGIFAGLSQGVAEGLKTYIGVKQMLMENAMKQRLNNAQNINAYANLISKGGTDIADQYTGYLGIDGSGGGGKPAAHGRQYFYRDFSSHPEEVLRARLPAAGAA